MSNNIILQEIISEKTIKNRVKELAKLIQEDFNNSQGIVFIGLLKGSVIFMADLLRAVQLPTLTMDFMSVSSYGNTMESSSNVKILQDLEADIQNKDVVIVEDIIDTGLTLQKIVDLLLRRNPNNLAICTLLDKSSKRLVDIKVDYIGFTIPNDFVVGYGIDYAQKYRNLPYLAKVIQ